MLTDHLTNIKQRVRISLVDPSTRTIQGVLRDGASASITVWEVPVAFVWPKVDEQWTVRRESGMWLLGHRIESMDQATSIDTLATGQAMLAADSVIDSQGRTLVTVDLATFVDGAAPVWNAATQEFIPGGGGGGSGGPVLIADVVGLQTALDAAATDANLATHEAQYGRGGHVPPTGVPVGDLAFDPATQAELDAAVAPLAPLASPTFTGDPQAPTPATADNDTSIATTAFVKAQGYAPLASPTFTGDPKAPTPASGDSDTSIATTAFVQAAIATGGATPEAWHLFGSTGNAAYLNGWGLDLLADDSNYAMAAYYKDPSGRVHLKGAVTAGGRTAAKMTVLPVGYRPIARVVFFIHGETNLGVGSVLKVYIDGNGDFAIYDMNEGVPSSSLRWISLDPISFRAEH